jgi:hypothetical protein
MLCCRADATGVMSMTELLTRLNAQSSVPVAENELKDALRTLGDNVNVNWIARTVEAAA